MPPQGLDLSFGALEIGEITVILIVTIVTAQSLQKSRRQALACIFLNYSIII